MVRAGPFRPRRPPVTLCGRTLGVILTEASVMTRGSVGAVLAILAVLAAGPGCLRPKRTRAVGPPPGAPPWVGSGGPATPFLWPGVRTPPVRRAADAHLPDDTQVVGVVVQGRARAYALSAMRGANG